MFFKLLKWDFKNHLTSILLMLLSSLACFVFAMVTRLEISSLNVTFFLIAIFMTFGVFAFTLLRIPYISAKDIYSKVGLRTNMIPVRTSTLWHSKIIVGFVFSILAIVVVILNFNIIGTFSIGEKFNAFEWVSNEFTYFSNILSQILNVSNELAKVLIAGFIILSLLLLQFSFGFYVALSNSKIFNRQAGVRYLLGYVLYYFGFQIIALIGMFFIPLNARIKIIDGTLGLALEFKNFFGMVSNSMADFIPIGLILFLIVLLFSQYFLTRRMMDRHLNI